ncbi:cytochrome P450 [Arthrobacter sp. KNU40]|uniref:cytochrome P450 n=1 Tax=Arthrobacter sp. KNU40 TaxID=3447965 RepID=UPI003F60DF18
MGTSAAAPSALRPRRSRASRHCWRLGRQPEGRERLPHLGRTDLGNRDPEAFEDPDTLDLERDARHHVAFGFGVHQCLGQPLARMELQLAYTTLLRRIPTLALATTLDQVPFKDDASVYGTFSCVGEPMNWP